MKIKSIAVENYKSFEKLSVDNLLPVNMVYGYNNSGKSNLLKFIELVFSTREYVQQISVVSDANIIMEPNVQRENFWEKSILNQPFIFRKDKGKKHDILFSICVEVLKSEISTSVSNYANLEKEYFNSDGAESVEIVINGQMVSSGNFNALQKLISVSLDGKEIYNNDTGSPKTFDGSATLTFNDFISLISIFNDCVLLLDNDRYFIHEQENSDLNDAKIDARNFKNNIFNISLSHAKESEIKDLISFIKEFTIVSEDSVFKNNEKSSPFKNFDFEFIRLNKELEVMLTNSFGRFPMSSFGTGIQQIIFILSKIFLSNKKIVLIEEIELNLSPKYQLELISFIADKLVGKKIVSQLFYSTHSPLMCYRSEFRTLQARINADGISTIEPIIPDKEDVEKFVAATKLLEHYHPPVKKVAAVASAASATPTVSPAATITAPVSEPEPVAETSLSENLVSESSIPNDMPDAPAPEAASSDTPVA